MSDGIVIVVVLLVSAVLWCAIFACGGVAACFVVIGIGGLFASAAAGALEADE